MKLPLLCGCDITSIFEGVKVSARRGRAIISLCFEGVKLRVVEAGKMAVLSDTGKMAVLSDGCAVRYWEDGCAVRSCSCRCSYCC